ncbi:MAG: hypothetical protein ACR2OE_01885 [Thermomicrobiales bacterium]
MIDGLIPTYSFYFDNPLRTGGSVERVLIINGVETSRDRIVYSLDSVELSLLNQETLPSRVGDFLDFACAASLADRFSPREVKADQRETSDRLRRRINVSLQMRESQLWSDDDTCHLLENLLDWITDDKWTFPFRGELLRGYQKFNYHLDGKEQKQDRARCVSLVVVWIHSRVS